MEKEGGGNDWEKSHFDHLSTKALVVRSHYTLPRDLTEIECISIMHIGI